MAYCLVEKFFSITRYIFSGSWTIKALKQRVRIGRFAFCLQEIYGIEQKAEEEEPESECAICWDEDRVNMYYYYTLVVKVLNQKFVDRYFSMTKYFRPYINLTYHDMILILQVSYIDLQCKKLRSRSL